MQFADKKGYSYPLYPECMSYSSELHPCTDIMRVSHSCVLQATGIVKGAFYFFLLANGPKVSLVRPRNSAELYQAYEVL